MLYEGDSPDNGAFTDFIRMRDIPVYRINEWLYDTDYMANIICETFRIAGTKGWASPPTSTS